jgi:transcriptional regulator with GAF, ATPase, and Fis domain
MFAAEVTKPKTKKPAKPKTKEKPERKKSQLVKIGDAAMREALLEALKRNDWNLAATSREMELAPPHMHRFLRALDLMDEYEAAKKERE